MDMHFGDALGTVHGGDRRRLLVTVASARHQDRQLLVDVRGRGRVEDLHIVALGAFPQPVDDVALAEEHRQDAVAPPAQHIGVRVHVGEQDNGDDEDGPAGVGLDRVAHGVGDVSGLGRGGGR